MNLNERLIKAAGRLSELERRVLELAALKRENQRKFAEEVQKQRHELGIREKS